MDRSKKMFERALGCIPGGVNSPVRAFRSVGGDPIFFRSGSGSHLFDVDGREYVDLVGSWGPLLFGHAHPQIVEAVRHAAGSGTSFGAPTEGEVELAERIKAFFPSIEKVRLVNSGTEATMSAIRLARAATGRRIVVKFDGGYHGHADSLLVEAGSGVATLSIAGSPGIPEEIAALTLSLPYNDTGSVEDLFAHRGAEIAAVIVEPVAGNMGVVGPQPGFLQSLRRVTGASGALLVFDEVITGFRVASGGAQELFGVAADLTCLGKIIGGGLPVGAYGGRAALMDQVAPAGPVYQAGTLSGNPLATAAGCAMLELIETENPYAALEKKGQQLEQALRHASRQSGVPIEVNRVGSMLTAFFRAGSVGNYAEARQSDTARFSRFFHSLLQQGVYTAPSQFEALFLSTAHTDADLDKVEKAIGAALAEEAGD
ncbi:MAG: glutamate-1-semialdehyde 2,1-aminomutase [Acidobacteriota bacterium]